MDPHDPSNPPPPEAPTQAATPPSEESPPAEAPTEPTPPPPPAPPVAWAPAQPTVAAGRRPVTGLAKVAASILIVLGALVTIFGVLLLGGGALLGAASSQTEVPFFAGVVGGLVFFFGVLVAGIGIIELLAGIGAWRGSSAGRIAGVVISVVFALFALASLGGSSDTGGSPLASLVFVLLYGFVAVVLMFRWKTAA